jgi:hypothetical protein
MCWRNMRIPMHASRMHASALGRDASSGLSAADACVRRYCDASLDSAVSALLVVLLVVGSAVVAVVMVVQVGARALERRRGGSGGGSRLGCRQLTYG